MQQRFAEQMAAQIPDMPPEVREWSRRRGGTLDVAVPVGVGFVAQLFVGIVFAPIGGMLGAVFFKKDVPPALGGDICRPRYLDTPRNPIVTDPVWVLVRRNCNPSIAISCRADG